MDSELGCNKGTKAQTFLNNLAAMTVMTQNAHMVVVFLLCHIAYGGLSKNVICCMFVILKLVTCQSKMAQCQVNPFHVL